MDKTELKEAREKLGLTIHEMAKALNTPYSTYVKWENGDRRVPGICKVAIKAVKKACKDADELLRVYETVRKVKEKLKKEI